MNTFQILFRKRGVVEHVGKIESASSAFRTGSLDVPDAPNCSGIMMEEFVDQLERIAQLLRRYQTMTHADCEDVRRTTSLLSHADEFISNLLR